MVDAKLIEILACPACKSTVIEDKGKIVCLKCTRSYPIEDGIPIMLIEEAEFNENK